MFIQLFLFFICANLQSMASQLAEPDTRVLVTIDDHYSKPDAVAVTVRESIHNPADGDEEYNLTLSLRHNKWIEQYGKTKLYRTHNNTYYPHNPVLEKETNFMPISAPIAKDKVPYEKRYNFYRLLNESAWRHIYVHSLAHSDPTLRQLCNNSPRWLQLMKKPHDFLKEIATLRKTEWGGKADAKHLALLGYNSVVRRELEKTCSAFQALYEKTKSPKDEKEYKKSSKSALHQLLQETVGLTFLHLNFPGWRQGVNEEIQLHEQQAAKKRERKEHQEELLVRKKQHAAWLKQRLAMRPQRIKDLFAQRELRQLKKENAKLQRKLKKKELNKAVRK